MKYQEFTNVIIQKSKNSLKSNATRNIIQACLSQIKKAQSHLINDA